MAAVTVVGEDGADVAFEEGGFFGVGLGEEWKREASGSDEETGGQG